MPGVWWIEIVSFEIIAEHEGRWLSDAAIINIASLGDVRVSDVNLQVNNGVLYVDVEDTTLVEVYMATGIVLHKGEGCIALN